jgi:hypothetical protein
MSDSNPPPADALNTATQMVKNGRLEQARETLMQYLMKNPSSEQAWLLMSYVLSDPAKQKDCLERVLKINPNNTVAQSKLAHLLGRRTEELFKKSVRPPQTPAPKPEPALEPEPAPKPELDLKPKPELKPSPISSPKPADVQPTEPLRPVQKSVFERKPASRPEPISPAQPEPISPTQVVPVISADHMPPPGKKPLFAGKWFRILTIALVALVLIIAAVILYYGVLGPALNTLLATPTPTRAPVSTVDLPLPPQWTQTLTPTETPVPPPTATPFLAPDFTPSETTIS